MYEVALKLTFSTFSHQALGTNSQPPSAIVLGELMPGRAVAKTILVHGCFKGGS